MALVRNNLSLRMKGRAGSFSFYSSKGRQVARVAQNSSNYGESARRSEAQQVRRVKWANLVNFYKLMGGTLHGAFETKRPNETDYNAFMRKNIPLGTVALTKDQASMGCCCVQKFIISEGSLPSVKLEIAGTSENYYYVTDLVFTGGSVAEDDPVAAVVGTLLADNKWMREGMQISLLIFSQGVDTDKPAVLFERHELTLNLNDEREIGAVWGEILFASDTNNKLSFPTLSTDVYAAVIVSDSSSGQLKVSSATIVAGDSETEVFMSSDAQVAAAMESYGVDAARFLDSGDMK